MKKSSNLLTPEHERCPLNALEYGWEDQEVKLDAKLNIVLVLKRRGQNVQTFAFALIVKTNEHTYDFIYFVIKSIMLCLYINMFKNYIILMQHI